MSAQAGGPFRIGRFRVEPLIDGDIVTEPSFAYPSIAEERWAPHRELLTFDGRVLHTVGAFLVRVDTHTILIDNGVGPDPLPPFTGGGLLGALARCGVNPSDLTVMLFTHLHFDHIGWTTRDGAVVFDNARHVANREDWDFFFSGRYQRVPLERPEDLPMRRLAPLTDRIELWSADDTEIVPGVAVRLAVGHTPGHAVVEIASEGERGLLIGDLAHHPVELLEDDWCGVGDVDAEQARRSAMRFVTEILEAELPFAAPHFPGLAWGRLERTGGARRWTSLEPERSRAALGLA